MARASVEGTLNTRAESSNAAPIRRNDDPLTLALRNGDELNLEDIARLSRAMSPVDVDSSLASQSVAVMSDQDDSTVTKPTSTGTSYPNNKQHKGKERAKSSYPSSLSVAYGSGSEAEAEQHAVRRDTLRAMGEWAEEDLAPKELLRGTTRSKRRDRYQRQPKHKKPIVNIIQPVMPHRSPNVNGDESAMTIASGQNYVERSYVRRRATQHDDHQFGLAEEGQISATPLQRFGSNRLSRSRTYVVIVLIFLIGVTFALSAVGAHHFGKAQVACTKGVVFAATVFTAFLTFLAIIVARRAPQEALLAGLLEIVIGFALLVELDDFM